MTRQLPSCDHADHGDGQRQDNAPKPPTWPSAPVLDFAPHPHAGRNSRDNPRHQGTHHAPILDPTVFEEIIPLHIRIVGFRAIDFYRHKDSLKNQPNTGSSLEELTQNPDHAIQFEDRSADPEKPTFERIYKQCEEALSKNEWEIIFILYVTQTSTVQDLIADDTFCAKMGLKPGVSNSTRRRLLAEIIEQALEKIRENMNF